MKALLIAMIQIYRWFLSPVKNLVFGPSAGCRFSPSCSTYGQEAIRNHGVIRGSWLLGKRLCRCHPWGGAGWDPVPAKSAPISGVRPNLEPSGIVCPSASGE